MVLETSAAAAAKHLSTNVADRLLNSLSGIAKNKIAQLQNSTASGFETYLSRNVQRCGHIRTLIKRNEPIRLTSLYVYQRFFVSDGDDLTDDHIIENLDSFPRIVVSGLAGSGKSMFMKYAFLRCVESFQQRIPIFFELKTLNDLDLTDDILYRGICKNINDVTDNFNIERLKIGLRNGLFSLFLDGFDELKHDRREHVEKELLRLCYSYPHAHVIVSSRPNETFDSWEEFRVLPIRAMSLDQIKKLVGNIEYDKSVKEKFLNALENGIYQSHRTFLENPLLATMMLLTFDQIGEVPNKMHIFYDKCFDVLVREHDTTKAVFVREMYSRLTPEDFKNFFTYFCAITYYDSEYDFNEEELKRYVGKTANALQWDIESKNIIKDFTESASIMQKDGTQYVFAHRSFQEYFMSRFVIRCKSVSLDKLIFPIQDRLFTDNVMQMAFDIDYEYMENNFLMPNLRVLSDVLKGIDAENTPKSIFKLFFCELYVTNDAEGNPRINYIIDGARSSYFVILFALEHIYYLGKGDLPTRPSSYQEPEYINHDIEIMNEFGIDSTANILVKDIEDKWFSRTYVAKEVKGLKDWILMSTTYLQDHIKRRNERLSDIIFDGK